MGDAPAPPKRGRSANTKPKSAKPVAPPSLEAACAFEEYYVLIRWPVPLRWVYDPRIKLNELKEVTNDDEAGRVAYPVIHAMHQVSENAQVDISTLRSRFRKITKYDLLRLANQMKAILNNHKKESGVDTLRYHTGIPALVSDLLEASAPPRDPADYIGRAFDVVVPGRRRHVVTLEMLRAALPDSHVGNAPQTQPGPLPACLPPSLGDEMAASIISSAD